MRNIEIRAYRSLGSHKELDYKMKSKTKFWKISITLMSMQLNIIVQDTIIKKGKTFFLENLNYVDVFAFEYYCSRHHYFQSTHMRRVSTTYSYIYPNCMSIQCTTVHNNQLILIYTGSWWGLKHVEIRSSPDQEQTQIILSISPANHLHSTPPILVNKCCIIASLITIFWPETV